MYKNITDYFWEKDAMGLIESLNINLTYTGTFDFLHPSTVILFVVLTKTWRNILEPEVLKLLDPIGLRHVRLIKRMHTVYPHKCHIDLELEHQSPVLENT